jgi:hypothetical protein
MNCREWEEKIALYAGGDWESGELERHLEQCAACREFAAAVKDSLQILREAHGQPLKEGQFAAVRAGVFQRLRRQRRWTWWPAWAGAAAAVALAASSLWLGQSRRTMPPAAARPKPAAVAVAQEAVATPVAPKPAPPRPRQRVRKKPPPPAPQPLLVKLITDDPDVVIYWIADPKGD